MDNVKGSCYKAAILGHVVADALGVPVEFNTRMELREDPVTDMMGYGTHNQPAGTWSDDSSMTLATLEWLGERTKDEADYQSLMQKFSAWIFDGEYTPYGVNFDNGIATYKALVNFANGMAPIECGGKSDYDNGNGSLMRILPIALYDSDKLSPTITAEGERSIFEISSLTHGHARSKVGCLIFSKIVADILKSPTQSKQVTLQHSLTQCKEYIERHPVSAIAYEARKYNRLWDVENFANLPEEAIKSSGYVLDTLEAALWCFLNTDNYKDCVLKAVNLGEDTDTVGAVVGGLAGLYYGMKGIPTAWLDLIPKRDWIEFLAEKINQ